MCFRGLLEVLLIPTGVEPFQNILEWSTKTLPETAKSFSSQEKFDYVGPISGPADFLYPLFKQPASFTREKGHKADDRLLVGSLRKIDVAAETCLFTSLSWAQYNWALIKKNQNPTATQVSSSNHQQISLL